jgi:hypothetical protein
MSHGLVTQEDVANKRSVKTNVVYDAPFSLFFILF